MTIKLLGKASELMGREELHVAVEWWTKKLLSEYTDDAGDFMINAAASWFKDQNRHPWDKPTERSVEKFKLSLLCLSAASFSDGWDESNPNWASANRTLSVDYGPNKILTCALEFAGISATLTLPIKTTMWISPQSVKVRCGHNSAEQVLFPRKS